MDPTSVQLVQPVVHKVSPECMQVFCPLSASVANLLVSLTIKMYLVPPSLAVYLLEWFEKKRVHGYAIPKCEREKHYKYIYHLQFTNFKFSSSWKSNTFNTGAMSLVDVFSHRTTILLECFNDMVMAAFFVSMAPLLPVPLISINLLMNFANLCSSSPTSEGGATL